MNRHVIEPRPTSAVSSILTGSASGRSNGGETLDTAQMLSAGHADVRGGGVNGDNERDRRGPLTGTGESGLDVNSRVRRMDATARASGSEAQVRGDNSRALNDANRTETETRGQYRADEVDSCGLTVNPLAGDNAISDTAVTGTDGKHLGAANDLPGEQPAERSALENDKVDEVIKQLSGIDTSELTDRDDMQKQSDFAYAQRTDDNLKHLWLREKAGSSELDVTSLLRRRVWQTH